MRRILCLLALVAKFASAQVDTCIVLHGYEIIPDTMVVSLTNECFDPVYLRLAVTNSSGDTVAEGQDCWCNRLLPRNSTLRKPLKLIDEKRITSLMYFGVSWNSTQDLKIPFPSASGVRSGLALPLKRSRVKAGRGLFTSGGEKFDCSGRPRPPYGKCR